MKNYILYKNVGAKLKKLRKKKKISVESVIEYLKAKGFSYSKDSIYKWEQGFSFPDVNVLVLLCAFYQCPIEFVLDESVINVVNLSPKELFLLDKYRYNTYANNISKMMYEMYLYEIRENKV